MIDKSDFMSAAELRSLLNVSDRTLRRYRLKHWVKGVHFVAPVQRVLYIRPMILDWIVKVPEDPIGHQDQMEAWVAKTQDKKRRRAS